MKKEDMIDLFRHLCPTLENNKEFEIVFFYGKISAKKRKRNAMLPCSWPIQRICGLKYCILCDNLKIKN
jgi:hypothetical protein